MRRSKFTTLFALGVSVVILTACAFYKPARVLAPEMFGMTCPTLTVCVEDSEDFVEVAALRQDAIAFVEKQLGDFQNKPRVMFCRTEQCSKRFGMQLTSGYNVGTYGVLIHRAGWKGYIIRHELIHHLQNERFGVVQASVRLPRWFIEGMAYSLSQDPRNPLPRPDIEAYRGQFESWLAAGNVWNEPPKNQ